MKVKVGDKVRIIGNNSGSVNKVGEIGVVTDLGFGDCRVQVEGNPSSGNWSVLHDVEIVGSDLEASTNYNDGKWHGHNGGQCPVHPETVVEVQYDEREIAQAKSFMWAHGLSSADIIAFRVIKEHREPREWWSLWSPSGNLIGNFSKESAHEKNNTHYNRKGDVIHVREVIE